MKKLILIASLLILSGCDPYTPDKSHSSYFKYSRYFEVLDDYYLHYNDKVAGLELFPIARNGINPGELVIKVGFRSDFDQPVVIFDFPSYVDFTHGEKPVVSFQFDGTYKSDRTFHYWSKEGYEFYEDCNFYGYTSISEDNCDEYIELIRQFQDKDQLVITIENASTMTYDLAEASENINALIYFMDWKNEDSSKESLEFIDTKCHANKDPDWSDFYSGLLQPFDEYTDEELLTMKDAYKEGDPMYWLSKNDPLYIDWNIPEKRGINVDRSEC